MRSGATKFTSGDPANRHLVAADVVGDARAGSEDEPDVDSVAHACPDPLGEDIAQHHVLAVAARGRLPGDQPEGRSGRPRIERHDQRALERASLSHRAGQRQDGNGGDGAGPSEQAPRDRVSIFEPLASARAHAHVSEASGDAVLEDLRLVAAQVRRVRDLEGHARGHREDQQGRDGRAAREAASGDEQPHADRDRRGVA
jgi:hypothetical protein